MVEMDRVTAVINGYRITGAVSAHVLEEVLLPSLESLMRRVPDPDVHGVLSLEELMGRTGKSRNYFTYPRKADGDRSRLVRWEEARLARRLGDQWLISTAVLHEIPMTQALEPGDTSELASRFGTLDGRPPR